jgi:hypothetical protein
VDLFNNEQNTVVALRRTNPGADKERNDQAAIAYAVRDLMQEREGCRVLDLAREIKATEHYLISDKHEDTIARMIMRALAEPRCFSGMKIWYQTAPWGKRTQHVVRRIPLK